MHELRAKLVPSFPSQQRDERAPTSSLSGELIHEIVAAMAKRMIVHELAAMPHYHPILAEIWTYPAEELAGQTTIS